jgi:hypothetical protein
MARRCLGYFVLYPAGEQYEEAGARDQVDIAVAIGTGPMTEP